MIVLNKEEVSENHFLSLLEDTKNKIKNTYQITPPEEIDGDIFETDVFNEMQLAARRTSFDGHLIKTGPLAFPDIIARKIFGVEVKMTESAKWNSTGNSIFESSRDPSVETIYIFFGKFGKGFDVKYRKYQECLYDIGVTHSPRYKIKMDLTDEETIFSKMGLNYDNFRLNPSIGAIRDYYRKFLKPGEDLWWMGEENPEEKIVSPIIQNFSNLPQEVQNQFINESFILFPEIFGRSKSKFEPVASYLMSQYNAVTASMRDKFSAGGVKEIIIHNKIYYVPRIIWNFYDRAYEIDKIFKSIPSHKLFFYWKIKDNRRPTQTWMKLLKHHSAEIDLVEIFKEGIVYGHSKKKFLR